MKAQMNYDEKGIFKDLNLTEINGEEAIAIVRALRMFGISNKEGNICALQMRETIFESLQK